MSSGEMEAYAVLFIVLLIAGNVIWVVYEVIRATGSPANTIHSIVTNLWQASAAALFITLTVAGISKGFKALPPAGCANGFSSPVRDNAGTRRNGMGRPRAGSPGPRRHRDHY